MPIEKTPSRTRGTEMPGGKVLQKVLTPLAKRHIGAYRNGEYPKKTDRVIPVIRLTPVSGS